jgi:hypothetical protein
MEVMERLRAAGIHLSFIAGALRCGPKHLLTDEHRQLIRTHKPALMALLQRRESQKAIVALYDKIGDSYGREDRNKLYSIPGWRDRFHELEDAFTAAEKAGLDCRREFEVLRDHWIAGLNAIDEERTACAL